ncbi:hypothetical protein ILUMI_27138 [Ignelater luminosus]|uniref:Uncharacterized protein n=1 Tax=Ignelater luminosus TaxID=2038154 RepID=A0A8K0FYG8_IGNLU|nr:hypothetical protein ILUMI_27138 [Ignelater luminosus]
MRRIQGPFGGRDSEEEKRRTRESVISNLVLFGVIVGLIRADQDLDDSVKDKNYQPQSEEESKGDTLQ